MAPTMGFWNFMDDVYHKTFTGEPVDWWCYIPVADPTYWSSRDATQPAEALSPTNRSLVAVNTDPLLEDLQNQNKALIQERETALRWQDTASMAVKEATEEAEMRKKEARAAKKAEQQAAATVQQQLIGSRQERSSALKWQDTASMAVKEAKEEAETSKQEARAAEKAGRQVAAELQRQLVEHINQIAALKRGKTRADVEKTRAVAEHREEIAVVQQKIKDLQTWLVSAISHGRGSIKLFDELSRISQGMLNELVAKDRKLAKIEKEKEELQERINARSSVFDDIRKEANSNHQAYLKSCREKAKSERAQRAAERKVGDLEREAVRVKAARDKSIKALEAKLNESIARETKANTRAIEAQGELEQLRRELDNTEDARQTFEKKDADWAALFSSNVPNTPDFGTESGLPPATITVVEASRPSASFSEQNSREDWERDTRHDLEVQNQNILATERDKNRHELDEEKRKLVARRWKSIRGNVKSSLKAHLAEELRSQELRKVRQRALTKRAKGKKGQVNWNFEVYRGFVQVVSRPVKTDRTQLETQIRSELRSEYQNESANRENERNNQHVLEQSQLEARIRSQFQNGFQEALVSQKSKWESEHAIERSRLVAEIRTELQTELQTKFSEWQTQFVDSERSTLESKIRADLQDVYQSGSHVEVNETGDTASATARSPEDDIFLSSLSRESDETHELLQEIGNVGITHGSVAYTVLQGLNRAKEALYDIKCELRKPDAIADKNNLLQAVRGVHINTHYIEKLSLNSREVLIRQAIEANRRLEYVKNLLGTNDDVAKDAMLKSLLEPLETESEPEHNHIPEYPRVGSTSGNATAFGASSYSQTVNGARGSSALSTSNLTKVNDSAKSAARGTSAVPPMVNSFGNVATSGISGSNQISSLSTDPNPSNSFGDGTALGATKTSTDGVFNPFEGSHFGNQPSLGSAHSQKDHDSGRSEGMTEINRNGKSHFKKTFQPLPPQGDVPAAPVGMDLAVSPTPTFNFADLSSTCRTDSSDKDHQMDTDGDQPPASAPQDDSGVIGVAICPSRSRKAKSSQGRSAPKGRQLAHQAFAKKQDTLTPAPAQTRQTKPQEQVPTAQNFGSFGLPRTAFTLEPNHAFDVTPSSSLADRGTHLRVQQDPAEYQKPLKIFQIPDASSPASEYGGDNAMSGESTGAEVMPPQAKDVPPETPPGCEGWTSEMEKYAQDFLKDADIEQFKVELWSLYPSTEKMPGLEPYLQQLKQDMETAKPDQVQGEQKSEQPAGWTTQMTEFVQGALGAGNDVKTTINLFRMEIVNAFDIQSLEAHVEKLKDDLVRKNNALANQHQVSPAPMGWTDSMTATIQSFLRDGNRSVESMVQGLEMVDFDAVHLTGVDKYVSTLMLKFQTRGQDEK